MFEKRKNSEKKSGLSLGLALLLLLGGIFAGVQFGKHMVEEPVESFKPPTASFSLDDMDTNINLTGEWIGTATEDYGNENRYDYRLVIEQEGNEITGMSYLDMVDSDIYSESPIAGTLNGNVFFYTEVSTTVLENLSLDNWCLSDTTLTYQVMNGQETLVGNWELAEHERPECAGITGRVILTRQPQ